MTKFVIARMPNPTQILQSSIAPEGYMSGQGDCSCEFPWSFLIVISCNDFMCVFFVVVFFAASLVRNALQVCPYVVKKSLLQNTLWPNSAENVNLDDRCLKTTSVTVAQERPLRRKYG